MYLISPCRSHLFIFKNKFKEYLVRVTKFKWEKHRKKREGFFILDNHFEYILVVFFLRKCFMLVCISSHTDFFFKSHLLIAFQPIYFGAFSICISTYRCTLFFLNGCIIIIMIISIYWTIAMCQCYPKCWGHITSFNPHNNLAR